MNKELFESILKESENNFVENFLDDIIEEVKQEITDFLESKNLEYKSVYRKNYTNMYNIIIKNFSDSKKVETDIVNFLKHLESNYKNKLIENDIKASLHIDFYFSKYITSLSHDEAMITIGYSLNRN